MKALTNSPTHKEKRKMTKIINRVGMTTLLSAIMMVFTLLFGAGTAEAAGLTAEFQAAAAGKDARCVARCAQKLTNDDQLACLRGCATKPQEAQPVTKTPSKGNKSLPRKDGKDLCKGVKCEGEHRVCAPSTGECVCEEGWEWDAENEKCIQPCPGVTTCQVQGFLHCEPAPTDENPYAMDCRIKVELQDEVVADISTIAANTEDAKTSTAGVYNLLRCIIWILTLTAVPYWVRGFWWPIILWVRKRRQEKKEAEKKEAERQRTLQSQQPIE